MSTNLYGGGTVSDLAVSGLAQEGMAVLMEHKKKQHQANFVAAQQKHGDETKSDQQKRDNAAKRDPCFLLNKSVTTRSEGVNTRCCFHSLSLSKRIRGTVDRHQIFGIPVYFCLYL
jgi:hypothetical protein